MNATPPTGTETPGPAIMGGAQTDNTRAPLQKDTVICFAVLAAWLAFVGWIIWEAVRAARLVIVFAVIGFSLSCHAQLATPVSSCGTVTAKAEWPQASGFRWSRHEWVSLRDTITNRHGEVLDVRLDVLRIWRRIGLWATNADFHNQIVRHQVTHRKIKPWEMRADGQPRWIDPDKFAAFSGKRIVMPSDGPVTFDNYTEEKPGVECAEIVIGQGTWLVGYFDDAGTLRTLWRASAGQIAGVCRPVGSSRVYFLIPE